MERLKKSRHLLNKQIELQKTKLKYFQDFFYLQPLHHNRVCCTISLVLLLLLANLTKSVSINFIVIYKPDKRLSLIINFDFH